MEGYYHVHFLPGNVKQAYIYTAIFEISAHAGDSVKQQQSFFLPFFFFLQLYCPIGISPMEISGCFPRGNPAATVDQPSLRQMLGALIFS